ncbi:hypothetical protein ACUHMQ_19880 [Chitinimonas sp. PSY-7]|uniref:hypothetical protein n=1 Tax=Chitinimonas sp. PSY-7 TaxID=3459088 RepID=UPI0040400484
MTDTLRIQIEIHLSGNIAMPIQHLTSTIAALSEGWFLGPSLGPKYGERLASLFNSRPDKQNIDDALALGSYPVHSETNKQSRHALRAVLLANFLIKNQPVAIASQLREQYKSLPLDSLKQRFINLFPAFLDNGNRNAWGPHNFTNIAMLNEFRQPTDWRARAIPPYKLMVHTLKHPSTVLNAPVSTLSGWTAISMSVLSSTKPIAYSNHGVILGVPQNNILSTSPTDQWFDNYAGTSQSTKAPGQSMAQHIAEKSIMLGGMLTPDEVILKQNTPAAFQHFAGAALTRHNEIVVCGVAGQPLPHGMTGVLQLLGVFIQTNMDGTLPPIYFRSQGKSQDIERAASACARQYQVPLLYLPTHEI